MSNLLALFQLTTPSFKSLSLANGTVIFKAFTNSTILGGELATYSIAIKQCIRISLCILRFLRSSYFCWRTSRGKCFII